MKKEDGVNCREGGNWKSWKCGCCQIKRERDRPADRGIDGSRGGMEMRKRRMGEVDV